MNLAPEWRRMCEENKSLRTALESIVRVGSLNLTGEYEHSLRDIIRSMTDCAKNALGSAE